MIIDFHAHIWAAHPEEDKAAMRRAAKLYGIEKIYVSGLKSHISDEDEIAMLNDMVYQAMQEDTLFGGAVYVNPLHKNVMDVIRRACEDRGFEIIKLWICTLADVPQMDPIMEYAAANGIPVLFHSFCKTIGQIPTESTGIHCANIARRHPETKIVMAHLGGNCYHGIPAIRDLPNVFCDFSGSIFTGDALNYAAEYLGTDRLVFGTDMPGSFLVNLGQVTGSDLTVADQQKLLRHNALKLLNRNYRL